MHLSRTCAIYIIAMVGKRADINECSVYIKKDLSSLTHRDSFLIKIIRTHSRQDYMVDENMYCIPELYQRLSSLRYFGIRRKFDLQFSTRDIFVTRQTRLIKLVIFLLPFKKGSWI